MSSIRVYDDLLAYVRRGIARGRMKPGAFIGSELELAREAGISRVSVRRATDELIREGLIERRAGKGLFVRPSDRGTRLVQVIVPDMAFDQCVQIARGAQALGIERGVQVQTYDAHSRMDWDMEVLRQLPRTSPHGAIIVSWHHIRFTEALYELKREKYPFVLVDERARDLVVPSVLADNYGGGVTVGRALVELGHRRIAFVGNLRADTAQSRLQGLRDAINDAGIAFDRSMALDLDVQPEGDWEGMTIARTRQLLDMPDRPTAIFFGNDHTAAHGYRAIKAAGLRIPEDISVVGFDDDPLCRWLEPQLSTVKQPSLEIGRTAMEMLLQLPENRPASTEAVSASMTIPTVWTPRASIGPVPGGSR
jgi:DNA-binding LacI/PurR family transcriptional regulator